MREGSTAALGSVAVRLGENVCVLGVSCAGPGRLDTQPDGTPVITIENGVLRAHGFRTVSLEEFRTRVSELQKELDERTRAEIDAAGAVNLFLPAPFDAA